MKTCFNNFGAAVFLLASSGVALAGPIPLNLSNWTPVDYIDIGGVQTDGPANWIISEDGTEARQTLNTEAAILLSDIDVADSQIEGTWRVEDVEDDDFMGFVFGYQNPGQFYLFDWKQGEQRVPNFGVGDVGMNLRLIDAGPEGVPTVSELWLNDENTGPNVEFLRDNDLSYDAFVDYSFRLNFQPGLFEITILEGEDILENWLVEDDTFTSGQFGFYNLSQPNVVYSGFTLDDEPPELSEIPVPATLALMGLGLLGLVRSRRY